MENRFQILVWVLAVVQVVVVLAVCVALTRLLAR